MVATTHRSILRQEPAGGSPMTPEAGPAARALARGYLHYVSALWRGERNAADFAIWLDRFWCADLPPSPARVPDAISPHGGGGHGIAWFGTTDEVRGYISGIHGGYRVPLAAVAGVVPARHGSEAHASSSMPRDGRPHSPAA